jgi:hypothetical protein
MGKANSNNEGASANHAYKAGEFAARHGLSLKAAEIILFSNGPSRVACDAAAKAFLAAIAIRSNRRKPGKG